uniref:Uncharacterized protein n=1 Tax=Arundo donax TaxID=35708 RepID=A0A0A8XZL8_ARUDO
MLTSGEKKIGHIGCMFLGVTQHKLTPSHSLQELNFDSNSIYI